MSQPDPASGDPDACKGSDIFEYNADDRRILPASQHRKKRSLSGVLSELTISNREIAAFKNCRSSKHYEIPQRVLQCSRVQDMPQTLIEGESSSDGEHQNAHYEVPKVRFLPVAQWMLCVGRASTALLSIDEQRIVAQIGH
jgi:hypothetical protein